MIDLLIYGALMALLRWIGQKDGIADEIAIGFFILLVVLKPIEKMVRRISEKIEGE